MHIASDFLCGWDFNWKSTKCKCTINILYVVNLPNYIEVNWPSGILFSLPFSSHASSIYKRRAEKKPGTIYSPVMPRTFNFKIDNAFMTFHTYSIVTFLVFFFRYYVYAVRHGTTCVNAMQTYPSSTMCRWKVTIFCDNHNLMKSVFTWGLNTDWASTIYFCNLYQWIFRKDLNTTDWKYRHQKNQYVMSSFNEYLLSLKENVSNSMVTTLTPSQLHLTWALYFSRISKK